MRVYFVRHARAQKRAQWDGAESMRPLDEEGWRQANGIAARLEGSPIERILSAPERRCRQSVEPLSAACRVAMEIEPSLGGDADTESLLAFLRGLGDTPAVLSTHRDRILSTLIALSTQGLDRGLEGELRCERGAVWIVSGPGSRPARANYLLPGLATVEGSPPPSSERPTRRGAVLDLGSNSFHLLVGDVGAEGSLTPVVRERVMLRLGAELVGGGEISEPACVRAVDTAMALADVAASAGAERLVPVATAALRDATNGAELADRLQEAIQTPVRMLPGVEEARLIFRAFRQRVSLPDGLFLGMDLGGGSLEVAVGDRHGVGWESTHRLGVSRIHGELVSSDPMSPSERNAIEARVRADLAPVAPEISQLGPGTAVVAGGSVRALARLWPSAKGSARAKSNGKSVRSATLAELDELTATLVASDHDERLRMAGMQMRRADLMPTAAVLLREVISTLGFEEWTICDWGLREGVLLEEFAGAAPTDAAAEG